MLKEFIPYTEAVALKELGFEETCIRIWTKDNQYGSKELRGPLYKTPIPKDAIRAPLWQQAFRFFRETNNLNHTICIVAASKYGIWIHKDRNKIKGLEKTYTTYEEAEQACLEKLIEIVKNLKHEQE